MATVASLAIKRSNAIDRLKAVAATTGVALDIPTHARDTTHLQASQLEVLATWAESALGSASPATLTDDQFGAALRERMAENNISTLSTKADIVAFLEVYLGDAG